MSSNLSSFFGRLADRLRGFSLASWWRTSSLGGWWRERSIWGKVGWPLLAYIVVFSMFSDGTDGAASPADIGRATSIRVCQDAVRERLKAPSTAEFSGESYQAPQSHKRVVTGDVDAQNSYGAMLRSSWSCTLRRDGRDWYVDDVTIR